MKRETLRELVQLAIEIESALVDSGGELNPSIERALEVKDVELPAKVDAYAALIDRLKLASEYYKEKEEFYAKLKRAAEKSADKLKHNICMAMKHMGTNRLDGNDIKFVTSSRFSAVITNEEKIPDTYKIIKTSVSYDRQRLLKDLKTKEVEGAELRETEFVRQFPKKEI